jgi:glycosyltransferase involved in cell wall biosynthesis
MSARKLLFLATEDWFVRSHFLPLLRRARAEGYEVVVAARLSGALDDEAGVRLIDMPFARRSLAPGDVWREARALRMALREERPDLVHAIALKPIALQLAAGGQTPSVLALTGRGYLSARGGWRQLILGALATRLRAAVARGQSILLVENNADRGWVEGGQHPPDARVLQMPGAGVDPAAFTVAPEPNSGPIVVGVVARLVRSKGADLAVATIRQLRARGLDIVLRIAGEPDADNPEQVEPSEIEAWRATPCVELTGRIGDINAFWARAHIACLPSRGGEGLPRALLEAAACGRPIVTTDVPGCTDFVLRGETGLVAPSERADMLAEALATLAQDAALRARMGAAARARVVASYTEAHAADCAAEAWRRCLDLTR